jgi:hypothetical protein
VDDDDAAALGRPQGVKLARDEGGALLGHVELAVEHQHAQLVAAHPLDGLRGAVGLRHLVALARQVARDLLPVRGADADERASLLPRRATARGLGAALCGAGRRAAAAEQLDEESRGLGHGRLAGRFAGRLSGQLAGRLAAGGLLRRQGDLRGGGAVGVALRARGGGQVAAGGHGAPLVGRGGGLRVDDVLTLRAAHREGAHRHLRVVELHARRAVRAGNNHKQFSVFSFQFSAVRVFSRRGVGRRFY